MLAIWTWTPERNLRHVAFMMTPQHVQSAVEHGYITSHGECQYMMNTYWIQQKQRQKQNTYQYDQYLILQQRLQQEEKERKMMEEMIRHVDEQEQKQHHTDEELVISGQPSARIHTAIDPTVMKKESAQLQRLAIRRAIAETRIQQHQQQIQHKDRIAEQVMIHRIKMETVHERECEARQARALSYESYTNQLQIEYEYKQQQKHEMMQLAKDEHIKRMEWVQMDREWEHNELRK